MYEITHIFMTACLPEDDGKQEFSSPADQDADEDKRRAQKEPPQFAWQNYDENDQRSDTRYAKSDGPAWSPPHKNTAFQNNVGMVDIIISIRERRP
ncbi:hypothetical protein [Sporobacter termitidis]|uniref:hypothetical protein n=1 Tax=Sporobacter termitidis TaxID=44749 RepID=UPI001160CA1F|nr:hypothetical protein [Sporobacter termitidis]